MALISNKKIGMHYETLERLESGIELFGYEVKSIRNGQGSLEGARVLIRGGEAYVVGIYIPAYQEKNTTKSYDAYRTRRLLLKKNEITRLFNATETKDLTLVPISLYLKNNLIKCEVGLCKKKQKGDKRENIKKDIARREIKTAGL